MKTKTALKILSLVLGIIFLVSVLTVESHAHAKGSLGAKCPTVIESTVELAVGGGYESVNEAFRPIDYVPLPLEMVVLGKSIISPYIYRSPPFFTR